MLEFVEVGIGTGGGVPCGRCGRAVPAAYRDVAAILAEVSAACEAWGAAPGPNVALTGPDPFGHPELPALLAAAASNGVERLRLDTDGAGLAVPGNAARVLAAGVRHVRVTLLGGQGTHDALSGAPGAFERALSGMRAFADAAADADARVSVSARVPVCRHVVHEAPAAVSAAAESGARHVLLEVTDPGLDAAATMPWIAAACDTGTVNSVWVEAAGVPYCLAGDHTLHLVPVLRNARLTGEKGEACAACRLQRSCEGLVPGAAPQVKAALAPPDVDERLAESIERAYLSPTGPGELE